MIVQQLSDVSDGFLSVLVKEIVSIPSKIASATCLNFQSPVLRLFARFPWWSLGAHSPSPPHQDAMFVGYRSSRCLSLTCTTEAISMQSIFDIPTLSTLVDALFETPDPPRLISSHIDAIEDR